MLVNTTRSLVQHLGNCGPVCPQVPGESRTQISLCPPSSDDSRVLVTGPPTLGSLRGQINISTTRERPPTRHHHYHPHHLTRISNYWDIWQHLPQRWLALLTWNSLSSATQQSAGQKKATFFYWLNIILVHLYPLSHSLSSPLMILWKEIFPKIDERRGAESVI